MSSTIEKGKHTPGPWQMESDGNVYETERGRIVAISASMNMDANARLIAAAPELLAACKAVLRDLDKPWSVVAKAHFSELLHTAIARAEGKV